ncbi:YceI family protein [Fodinibius salsisoli]|uniref:YceI family protein n=1 Tax=Fodinibius salsisoli TaxID=2820877 RepID=A0ABT3PMY2_9BACT|nr:YceI family protein [Fodinibius salsisoli]MCW9707296.1 YceI family protein [Fodinibius salsisoli]
MKTLINYILAALLIIFLPIIGWAQSVNYNVNETSTLVIKGTSTIHDWEADVEKMDINIALEPATLQQDPITNPVANFSILVPVESIESGKGRMNRKIYGALEKDDYPQIKFELTKAELVESNASSESFELNSSGTLTIKGNSRDITFPVKATQVDGNNFRFEGSYSINMKDYDVDPPSAMFGTIKSGEEVEVVFNILVSK